MITEESVWSYLEHLQDSMFGEPLSVVDVGMIYEVRVTGSEVYVAILMFNRGRVLIDAAASPIRQHLLTMDGVSEVSVEVLWEPEWTPDRLSPQAREVLGFTPEDPPEGGMHVRAETRADVEAEPVDRRERVDVRLQLDSQSMSVTDLPRERFARWWGGWRYFRRFTATECSGLRRLGEPVHVDVVFTAGQVRDPAREIRIVEEDSAKEVSCQVYAQACEGDNYCCSVVFRADVEAFQQKTYLLLHGNPSPACWTPFYPTELVTRGEGYALEIDNGIYKVRLSPVMGHLRNLEFCRWGETRLGWDDPSPLSLIDAANDPLSKLDIAWHGEDHCIHWNPDFRNQLRYRMTNWPQVPNWEVSRGPVSTIVKRWGYPVCPTHPARGQNVVKLGVTYEFYDGLPYFSMSSALEVEEEADILVVRNDEWLFRQAFSHTLRMNEAEDIVTGPAVEDVSFNHNPALVGFFDEESNDAFASLRLAYDARGFPGAYHPQLLSMGTTSFGNQFWGRDVFHVPSEMAIQPGSWVTETNAYLCFSVSEGGLQQAEEWYRQLRVPLLLSCAH